MSDSRRDIPTPGAPNFDERVKETLSVALGFRGDSLDRMLTVRDLSDANIITLRIFSFLFTLRRLYSR